MGKLQEDLEQLVFEQPAAIAKVVPYVQAYTLGVSDPSRPAGTFLFLGPTGTGKTHLVHSLAKILHGNARNVLRVDCGEFQLEHEVARLIGAPPGYLGHRETVPVLTQQKLNAIARVDMPSLVLFDEIEKAASSLQRILLGVLDTGILKLGDNTTVTFARSLIFMTSNLGAREMQNLASRSFGLAPVTMTQKDLERIGVSAAKRHFSPEFWGRIDAVATFQELSEDAYREILQRFVDEFTLRVRKSGRPGFHLRLSADLVSELLAASKGSPYGARPLRQLFRQQVEFIVNEALAKEEIGARPVRFVVGTRGTLSKEEAV